jgi:hypothetical protein
MHRTASEKRDDLHDPFRNEVRISVDLIFEPPFCAFNMRSHQAFGRFGIPFLD